MNSKNYLQYSAMQQGLDSVEDYQFVNPYEMMYRNMNFDICEGVTQDTAEKVSKQLGFIHNAFGIVTKDLIKILSLKFKPHTTQETHRNNRPPHHQKESKKTSSQNPKPPQPQPMDLEGGERVQTTEALGKKVVVSLDSSQGSAVLVAGKEGTSGFEQKGQRVENPPNQDIFDQFSYEKSGHEESKNPPKSKLDPLFKERLSRIVEEVSNKRKKQNKFSSPQAKEQVPEIEENEIIDEERKDVIQEVHNGEMIAEQKEEKGSDERQEESLNDCENRSSRKESNSPQLLNSIEQKAPEPQLQTHQNQVRTLLQKLHQPDIYEISDDD